jgi:hypothetical protein
MMFFVYREKDIISIYVDELDQMIFDQVIPCPWAFMFFDDAIITILAYPFESAGSDFFKFHCLFRIGKTI